MTDVLSDEFDIDSYVPEHPLADNSTYGNIGTIPTKHVHLDWEIDFESSNIYGYATHDFEVKKDTRVVVLDAWDIDIIGVLRV